MEIQQDLPITCERVTKSQLAQKIGVSKPYVSKKIKDGTLVFDKEGKIDLAAAKDALKKNSDPARALTKDNATSRIDDSHNPAQQTSTAGVSTGDTPAATVQGDDGKRSFTAARTEREEYQAKLAKLQYEEKIGQLLPRDAVVEAMVTAGRKIQRQWDQLESWVDELYAAAQQGPAELKKLVKEKKRKAQEEAADYLTLAESDDA